MLKWVNKNVERNTGEMFFTTLTFAVIGTLKKCHILDMHNSIICIN